MQVQSLAGLLEHQLEVRPTHSALVMDDVDLDWATLAARTRRLANGLHAIGVQPGDRVAYLDRNAIEYFEFVFATAALNSAAVVLNWRLTATELAYILGDAAPAAVVVRADMEDRLRRAVEESGTSVPILVVGAGEGRGDDYETWLGAQLDTPRPERPSPDDVVIQMYTSGTTGRPKGAQITNASFAALLRAAGQWRMDETSVNLAAMPLFHIGGGGWALSGMAYGARTVVVREPAPDRLIETMARESVTHAFLVPSVIQLLLEEPTDVELPALRFLAYGASPIPEPVLRRALERFGNVFCQLYGMTETTGAVVQLDPEEHVLTGPDARLLKAAGKAMPGVELRITDPSDGGRLDDGEVGEVWIRTASVMLGYWRLPDATDRVLHPDGWFRSGDLGYLEDGYLFICGRLGDMIISGGENIYPAEVVSVLMSHEAVVDAAVVGVPSERWGETPRAVVVRRAGHDVSAEVLLAHCREQLASYKCPTEFHFLDELPRNASGKLRRDLLAGPLAGAEPAGRG